MKLDNAIIGIIDIIISMQTESVTEDTKSRHL